MCRDRRGPGRAAEDEESDRCYSRMEWPARWHLWRAQAARVGTGPAVTPLHEAVDGAVGAPAAAGGPRRKCQPINLAWGAHLQVFCSWRFATGIASSASKAATWRAVFRGHGIGSRVHSKSPPNDFAARCANAIVLGGEHKVRDGIIAAQRCQTLNLNPARADRILATQYFRAIRQTIRQALRPAGRLVTWSSWSAPVCH